MHLAGSQRTAGGDLSVLPAQHVSGPQDPAGLTEAALEKKLYLQQGKEAPGQEPIKEAPVF